MSLNSVRFGRLKLNESNFGKTKVSLVMVKPYAKLMVLIACATSFLWLVHKDILQAGTMSVAMVFLATELFYVLKFCTEVHTIQLELVENKLRLTQQSLLTTKTFEERIGRAVLAIEEGQDQTLMVLDNVGEDHKISRLCIMGNANSILADKDRESDFRQAIQKISSLLQVAEVKSADSLQSFLEKPNRIQSLKAFMNQRSAL